MNNQILIKLNDDCETIIYLKLDQSYQIYIDMNDNLCIYDLDGNGFDGTYSSIRKANKDYEKIYKLLFDTELVRKKTIKEQVEEEMKEFDMEDDDEM